MGKVRYLLWTCLVLGVLWAGYWFVGARMVRSTVEGWFADGKAAGLVAENSGISVAGFADRFDLTISDPHLADPAYGWGWKAPFAQVFAMTWKPWHLIAALPHTQEIDLADGQKVTLGSTRMMGSLLMRPDAGFEPVRLVVEGEGLTLTSDASWKIAADKTVLAAENDTTRANTLHIGADAANVTLPDTVARSPDIADVVALFHLDASLGLSEPVSWTMADPQVLSLTVTWLHVTWGALDLTAEGSAKPDSDGFAEGTFELHLKGWRNLPAIVVALGLVPPQNKVTVQRGLEYLAASSPDPEVLSLPLTLKAGTMSLGPLPLGPAPRLN